jgi:hypothetical protein
MPNTINIVQPKAEDGVTEVSFVTRTNSIFKSDGTPLGDSMDVYMDEVDELSQDVAELQNNRIGTYVSLNTYTTFANAFVAPSDGYIMARSGGTLGDVIMVDVENKVHISTRCEETNYSVYTTLYIRKGMRVHVNTNTGNRGNAYFYPITET